MLNVGVLDHIYNGVSSLAPCGPMGERADSLQHIEYYKKKAAVRADLGVKFEVFVVLDGECIYKNCERSNPYH